MKKAAENSPKQEDREPKSSRNAANFNKKAAQKHVKGSRKAERTAKALNKNTKITYDQVSISSESGPMRGCVALAKRAQGSYRHAAKSKKTSETTSSNICASRSLVVRFFAEAVLHVKAQFF